MSTSLMFRWRTTWNLKNTRLRDPSLKTARIINDLNIKQMFLPSVSAILWDGDVVEMSLYFRKEVVVVLSG